MKHLKTMMCGINSIKRCPDMTARLLNTEYQNSRKIRRQETMKNMKNRPAKRNMILLFAIILSSGVALNGQDGRKKQKHDR
jgi:hypothetical protein